MIFFDRNEAKMINYFTIRIEEIGSIFSHSKRKIEFVRRES